MSTTGEPTLDPSAATLERLARTLRHEVGDLLQTVYSAAAILQARLPRGADLERRLLTDLHNQAETCKHKVDAAHDLACRVELAAVPMDLAELLVGLAARLGPRFPNVRLDVDTPDALPVIADGLRLGHIGYLLIVSACQAARGVVRLRTWADGEGAAWSVQDDGPGATPEQLSWRQQPFATTQNAQLGLGLALAQRVAALHGGAVEAGNVADGGLCVTMRLPAQPPRA